MQYNPGDGSGIVDEILDWCDTDITNYTIDKITRRVNAAYEKVVGWLINADGLWQFDDDNYSTLNEGTTDLVVGQSDYSFASTFLDIEWVKVANASGFWLLLEPIDQSMTALALETYLRVNAFPRYYDKQGTSIRLYPAPDANSVQLAGGLKTGFQRTASTFTTSDTTKSPGFASPYHVILAYMAARPYCMTYKKDRVPELNALIGDLTPFPTGLKAELLAHYANREKDSRKQLTTRPIRGGFR